MGGPIPIQCDWYPCARRNLPRETDTQREEQVQRRGGWPPAGQGGRPGAVLPSQPTGGTTSACRAVTQTVCEAPHLWCFVLAALANSYILVTLPSPLTAGCPWLSMPLPPGPGCVFISKLRSHESVCRQVAEVDADCSRDLLRHSEVPPSVAVPAHRR